MLLFGRRRHISHKSPLVPWSEAKPRWFLCLLSLLWLEERRGYFSIGREKSVVINRRTVAYRNYHDSQHGFLQLAHNPPVADPIAPESVP